MIDWSKFNLAKQSFQTCETDGKEGLTWDEVDSCEVCIVFGFHIDAVEQQRTLNFELVVSDQLFSVILVAYN